MNTIVIDSKSSLTTFVQRVAAQTSINPSRLKTAISKAYGFKHITAFESALKSATMNADQLSFGFESEKETLIKYRENIFENIKTNASDENEDDEEFQLHAGLYEDAEDALCFSANELLDDMDSLSKALATLRNAGLSEVASKIVSVAKSSMDLSYLHENV